MYEAETYSYCYRDSGVPLAGATDALLITLPRDHHTLNRWLRIIPARPLIEDGDAKPAAAIAVRAAQTKLQIKDKCVRRHPPLALQESLVVFDAASARAAHHNHLMRREIAQP